MSLHTEGLRRKKYLCSHDQFMVDDVVRGVTHPEQSAGGVQMAGHPSSHIHILPYSLNTQIQGMKTVKVLLDEIESLHCQKC